MPFLRYLLFVALWSATSSLFAQISFTNRTDLLAPALHYSGVALAVLDMNNDGRDDILRMNQGFRLAIEYQTGPGQPFRRQFVADLPDGSQWGICAADVDNNGIPDVLAGGFYDGIKIVLADAGGASFQVVSLDDPPTFAQGVNFADINGDGWLDAFVCHDDGPARIFLNPADGTGAFAYAPQTIDLSTVPASDGSGNYGSVWSDVDNDGDQDLYIAKCRQGVSDANDGRRINQFFRNDGSGVFVQDTGNLAGLRIGAQSWTADFGDIDNDGDFDCFVTNHDVSSQLLENDGAGHFTDISAASGLRNAITGLPVQAVFRDFDNDGFVDILVAGSAHFLFRNNGDKTFTRIPILDNHEMESFALGDLNGDGFLDIYAGYADIFNDPGNIPDALWLNSGNANHFFGLNLRGVQSNRSAVGAKICLYSALGLQVREVRSGESYGIMNSLQVHFGMGDLTQIDSVVVRWPSGTVETLTNPAVDQYLTLVEGTCVVAPVLAESDGNTVFCSGDSVRLFVPETYASYRWSTGAADAAITVQTAGQYEVTVTTAEGCTVVSTPISVVVDPVEIPSITTNGDTTFCAGGSVELTASPASAYWWSTGDTTASILVSQPGQYTVTTQGLCAQFQSAPQGVVVLEATLPVPVADTVAVGSSATLTASGDELIWYDAPSGGNVLFTGNPFKTPPLTEPATFWVANNALYDMPNVLAGMINHMGSNFAGQQTNGAVIFDCFSPFRLVKVKVYTNRPGNRRIVLLNSGGAELGSKTVTIPSGTSYVELNFDVPAGLDLKLTTDETVNLQSLGSNGPQLRRSDQGVSYPYQVPGYLSIKGSNFGIDRYYYFFEWEVDFPGTSCLSDRVPVTVSVDSTLVSAPGLADPAGLRIFPNPGNGQFQLTPGTWSGQEGVIILRDSRGRVAARWPLPAAADGQWLSVPEPTPGVYWLEVVGRELSLRRKLVLLAP